MIGKLTFADGTHATLGDDLTWSSNDAATARMLNTLYPASASPSLGRPGADALHRAAVGLNAKVSGVTTPAQQPAFVY